MHLSNPLKQILGVVAVTLAGCSTPLGPQHAYPEPRRATTELALVRSGLPQYRDPTCPVVGVGTLSILAVNGRRTYDPPHDPPRSIYVLPGEHTISVSYVTGPKQVGDTKSSETFSYYSGEGTAVLNLAAGDIIRLDVEIDRPRKRFRVVPQRQTANDCWPGDK